MLRRAVVTAACAAALLLPAAGASAAGTPYVLTSPAADRLQLRPPVGGSTIAVAVTESAGTVTLSPAATGAVPAGCSSSATSTTCTGTPSAVALDIAADALEVTLDGIVTQTVILNGGREADRLTVRNATIGTELKLLTDRGADAVEVSGSVAAITDVAGSDASDDAWRIDVPGLTGTLATGGGNDRVDAAGTGLALHGGDGHDTLTSDGTLRGEQGDDLLRPRLANQTVEGGDGADRVSFDGTATGLRLATDSGGRVYVNDAPAATIDGVEEVEGTDGADVMTGRDPTGPGDTGRDVLVAGPGDDVVQGRGGPDELDGGLGTDVVLYEEVPVEKGVTVDFNAGIGGPGDAIDGIARFERVITGPGADTVRTTGANETINTGEGADHIEAGGGDDIIDAGSGPATVDAGSGDDTLQTDLVNVFADEVNGGSGTDTIRTGPGDDLLRGGAGTDLLDAGPGADTVTYDERFANEPVNVSLDGVADDGAGGENDAISAAESVIGTPAGDTLTGDDGPNVLLGGDGADTIVGRGAADHLDGGAGRDVLDGGAGGDRMIGGPHEDRLLAFDGFVDLLDCGSEEDDAEHDGVDALAACEFARRLDVTSVGDTDSDGVADTFDCNPRDAAIRPGAVDIPGNGIDEDCTGTDRALPVIDSQVRTSFGVRRDGTRIVRLTPVQLPAKGRVRVTCKTTVRFRRRCPFTSRVRKPKGRSRSVALASLFKRRRLPLGTRIEVQITAPGHIGKVMRLTVRRTAVPRSQELCLKPGSSRPSRCPSNDDDE